jgi:hypothetical protein
MCFVVLCVNLGLLEAADGLGKILLLEILLFLPLFADLWSGPPLVIPWAIQSRGSGFGAPGTGLEENRCLVRSLCGVEGRGARR